MSHKFPFKTLHELGFVGQDTALNCTNDILSIYECNITYAFKKLCKNKQLFDKFSGFLATTHYNN